MISTQLLFLAIFLIILGTNMVANNLLHSLMVNYVFYNDKLSASMTRFLGFLMVIASLLLLLNYVDIFYILILFDCMLFIFLTLKGRNKSKLIKQKQLQKNIMEKEKYLEIKEAQSKEQESVETES
jgi:predicted membrane protein